jgi:outer membrane lipoprotein SlyB
MTRGRWSTEIPLDWSDQQSFAMNNQKESQFMNASSGKSHPIIVVAAIAVTVFSAVGIAAMTGFIPNTFSKTSPTQTAQEATAPTPATTASAVEQKAETPAPKPQEIQAAPKRPRVAPSKKSEHLAANEPVPAPTVPKICRECGVIESINTVEQAGQGSGLGAVAGGVVGGVLGHQVGQGRGKDLATIAGAVGGAFAGHQIEKSVKKSIEYDVLVRLEDNTAQSVHYQSDPGFRAGDRVKVFDGQIQHL